MKKMISILVTFAIALECFCFSPFSTKASAASSRMEKAIQWAINIANDNSHGYSQSNRWGPDYDCSSLVISALKHAGYDVGGATYTGDMRKNLEPRGFEWISWNQIGGVSNLKRGDILLVHHDKGWQHTEIYIGNNRNVGAHSDRGYPQTGDQTGTEISVGNFYSNNKGVYWDGVLRENGGSVAPPSDTCNCSTNCAGEYIVTTQSSPLTMRSGHGTGYSQICTIPKGTHVTVSKGNGSWAHVSYNGKNGYCSMNYLTKVDTQPTGNVMSSGAGRTVADGEYHIACYKNPEYGVTVRGVFQNDGANIDLWDDMHTDSNAFIFTYLNNGFYKIVNKTTGKALDVEYANPARGTNVIQWTYNGGNNQQWSVEKSGDGVYEIRSKLSGYYLDLDNAIIAEGQNIKVWEKTSWDAQGWRLISWSKKPTNVGIHAWVSASPMGDCPSTYNVGDYFYLCYELINLDTGKKIGDCGLNYTVTETIYDTEGNVGHTHQDNNDNNWIALRMDKVGSYVGKISVSGDINLEQTVSCTVKSAPSISLSYKFIGFDLADNVNTQRITATMSGSDLGYIEFDVDNNLYNFEYGEVKEKNGVYTVDISISTTKKIGSCTATAKVLNIDKSKELARATVNLSTFCSNDYGEWKIIDEPTCAKCGVKTKTCKYCGDVITESIPATGRHSFGAWKTTRAATKYSEGEETRYCTVCGKEETRATPKLNPAPSDITNFRVTSVTSNSVTLSWNKSNGATRYELYSEEAFKKYYIDDGETTSYTVSGLEPNKYYTFSIRAYNMQGFSEEVSTAATTKSMTVDSLKVIAKSDYVNITWENDRAVDYYHIMLFDNGKWSTECEYSGDGQLFDYRIKDLKPATDYKIRIDAYNSGNRLIGSSKTASFTTEIATISGIKATPSKNSIKLIWSKDNSAKYYKVLVWKNNKWLQLTQTKNNATTAYIVSKLSANKTYKFRVMAYNSDNKAIALSDISAKTLANVSNLKVTPNKNTVKLTWSKNSSAKYYKVFIWKNNKWAQLAKTKNNTTTAYTASKLSANKTYKFRVTAYNSANKAIAFSDISTKTLANIAKLKATATKKTVKLTWGKLNSAKNYKVSVWRNGMWVKITQTQNNKTLSCAAAQLTPNTKYKFRIEALNSSGKVIAFSDVSVKTKK